jgi:BirA family biotin operon repressor/biotin-[acetyl-CoA-carboxylase] ligase
MNTDLEILRALRNAGGGGVSGAELAQSLGISRAAIWARIEALRSLGYAIEASPHLGYQLVSSPDVLHADDLLSRLGKVQVVGREIHVFQETTSTSDLIERMARDGVREGVAVFAESQSRGRGRLGRAWLSTKGKGLWFSVLLRPAIRPLEATRLTVTSATALSRAIQSVTGLVVGIKWPNDLLIQGRKVGGILTEMSAELDRVRHIVLGIGIDVNQEAADFPVEIRRVATSLRQELKRPVSRAELATAVLRELDADYGRMIGGRFPEVVEEWERQCVTLGRDVSIRAGDRETRGRAEALDESGALLLRTEHGRLERVVGGDVTLLK